MRLKCKKIAGELQSEKGKAQRTALPLLSSNDPLIAEKEFEVKREIEEASHTAAATHIRFAEKLVVLYSKQFT